MIIKYKNEEYIVIHIFCGEYSKNKQLNMFCWNLKKSHVDYIDFLDAEIIDGRLPANMSLNRHKELNDHGDLVGWSCILGNDEIFKNADWFWNAFEDNEPVSNLLFHRIVNEMKAFHDLPLDDLSELEKAVQRQKDKEKNKRSGSEEERRKKKLNKELEEYLRIGEEIEKELLGK